MLPGGKLDPATWPNSGIGRLNPDGSKQNSVHNYPSLATELADALAANGVPFREAYRQAAEGRQLADEPLSL